MKAQDLFTYSLAALLFWGFSTTATADVAFEWFDVGDPGNPENPVIKTDGTTGYGAVDYAFRMAVHEVRNDQYAEFLNAVASTDTNNLFHPSMGSSFFGGIRRSGESGSYTYTVKEHYDNKPVNFVSYYDCARFANWIHNGQPTGAQDTSTTEDGAYTFTAFEEVGTRNPGAVVYIPDEHEWDKAAFYEPGAVTAYGDGWWSNPSHSDIFPTKATCDEFGNVANPGPHTAVFRREANWNGSTSTGNVTTVGSSGNESYYGGRDMSGNVFEWVIADPTKPDPNGWGPYTVRGGSFQNIGHMGSNERNLDHHGNHNVVARNNGFRLAAPALMMTADFDFDGDVDGDDFLVWQASFGVDAAGDADLDGDSDGDDFLLWQSNYGTDGGNAATSVVPEPGALPMAGFIALATLGAVCSKKRQRGANLVFRHRCLRHQCRVTS